MGAAHTANANTDMVSRKILPGNLTTMLVESGREHHVTMVSILVVVYYKLVTMSKYCK